MAQDTLAADEAFRKHSQPPDTLNSDTKNQGNKDYWYKMTKDVSQVVLDHLGAHVLLGFGEGEAY